MVPVKKGQIEMVGLLLIVILLVAIGLIFVSFYFNEPGKDTNVVYTLKANNLMNAVDQVTLADGNGGDLVKECCGNAQKCLELAQFYENEPDIKNLDEETSIYVNDDKIAGNCENGISSSTFAYGFECSARISICK